MKKFLGILSCFISLASLQNGFAANAPTPAVSPSPTPSASPSPAPTLTLNPTTLRTQLLETNNQILVSLNSVYQAKYNVDIARGNLLPSVNASALISSAASGPTFALSSISFLLPFLVPSNWFALKASEHELTADEQAYYILELNTFASAYGLYEVTVTDLQERDILNQQYENYLLIQNVLQSQAKLGFPVTSEDILSAESQTDQALYNVTQMDEMILQEKAALVQVLGMPVDTSLQFDSVELQPLPFESGYTLADLTAQAYAMAPEKVQYDALISAANDSKLSDVFAFMNSDTISASSSNFNGSGIDLGTAQQKQSLNFGFAYFPTIDLSKSNIVNIQLNEVALQQQLGETISTTVGSIASAVNQYNDALQAEQLQEQVYLMEIQKYQMGASTLPTVIQQQQSLTQNSTSRVKSQADLNALRISLARVFLTDEFANIKGCDLQPAAKKSGGTSILGWLANLLHPSSGIKTLDQMCKVTS